MNVEGSKPRPLRAAKKAHWAHVVAVRPKEIQSQFDSPNKS